MKKIIAIAAASVAALTLAACERDAQIASRNLSYAAENFEITRRTVFYNGITGEYMLEIVGRCSIGSGFGGVAITCKTGPDQYQKHFLGLSDNVTFFSEQIGDANVSAYHYRVTFKPQSIIPAIDLRAELIDLDTSPAQ